MTLEDGPKFFTTQEAARALRCSVATIRNLVKTGQLNPVKLGSRYCFSELDVQALLETGTDDRYKEFMTAKHAKAAAQVAAKRAEGELAEPHATIKTRRTLACLWRYRDELAEAARNAQERAGGLNRAEHVQELADTFEAVLGGSMREFKHVNWRSLAFAWLEAFEEKEQKNDGKT